MKHKWGQGQPLAGPQQLSSASLQRVREAVERSIPPSRGDELGAHPPREEPKPSPDATLPDAERKNRRKRHKR